MKILFACGRETDYTRNKSLLDALKSGHEVTDITPSSKSYIIRYLIITVRLIRHKFKNYDLIFIGFYGQPLVLFTRLLDRKRPIVFDAFISTYQTLCFDRKKFTPTSLPGKLAFWIDRKSCQLANTVLLDTNAHIDYFVKTFRLPRSKFQRVFVGADEAIFYPRKEVNNKIPIVFTYSQYQPLHGTEFIVRAAKQLEGKARFRIVGKGQERAKIDKIVEAEGIKNVELIDWLPYKKLPSEIARADICLGGHFGNTQKARMVIAGKTFQFIAMKKLTLVGNNDANKELFNDTVSDLFYVKHSSSDDISKKIDQILGSREDKVKVVNEEFKSYELKATQKRIRLRMQEVLRSTEV